MYNLDAPGTRWRTKDVSGYITSWDGEWFCHFRDGGYGSIEWVEIRVQSIDQDAAVLALLRQIHLPGHRIDQGFRIYSYARGGVAIDYV
jgi:Family of unknown function (DUF6678)